MINSDTTHHIYFGNAQDMRELTNESIHFIVTSPPYYNAPFDYPGLYNSYEEYLQILENIAGEMFRVLAPGRVAAIVTDDMLVKGNKYPIVADVTKIFMNQGFRYRDKIIWRKPNGYVRISRRSGVVLQHKLPMYFYPDNLQESILLFQKGRFQYQKYLKTLEPDVIEASRLDLDEFKANKWFMTVWDITNVLPRKNRLEKGIAAFPEEIPYRLIKLFSFVGETVLDPFLGSGTTTKVARNLGRHSVGYELDRELADIVQRKLDHQQQQLVTKYQLKLTIRDDSMKMRTLLNNRVNHNQES